MFTEHACRSVHSSTDRPEDCAWWSKQSCISCSLCRADGSLVSSVPGSSTLGEVFNGTDFTADKQLGGTVLNCSTVRVSSFENPKVCVRTQNIDIILHFRGDAASPWTARWECSQLQHDAISCLDPVHCHVLFNGSDFAADRQLGNTVLNCSVVLCIANCRLWNVAECTRDLAHDYRLGHVFTCCSLVAASLIRSRTCFP